MTNICRLATRLIFLRLLKYRFRIHIILTTIILLSFGSIEAKTYSIDEIFIQAEILPDGGLKIEESRTYSFKGKFSWAEYSLPLEDLGMVHDFSISEDGTEYIKSQDERPGTYKLEVSADQLYARWYYEARNESRTFVLRYKIDDAITVYDDAAELYYQFIGADNTSQIARVNVRVSLPDSAVYPEVRAWVHGPLTGKIRFQKGILQMHVSPMPANRFWETRILFPGKWAPDARNRVNSERLSTVLSEEYEWARQANQRRALAEQDLLLKRENDARALRIAVILSLAGIVFLALMYLKYGRGFDVPYHQEIDSQIPDSYHPVIVNCLNLNKQVSGSALSTALFSLAEKGVLAIGQISDTGWFKRRNFTLTINRDKAHQLADFEDNLIRFMFDEIGKGANTIESATLKKSSRAMRKWFRQWTKLIKKHLDPVIIWDKSSIRGTIYSAIFSSLVISGGILLAVFLGIPGLIATGAGAVCLGLSFLILRYTPEMKLKKKKWKAFRRYLIKFHTMDYESSLYNQIGIYLVYAIALGAGTKTIKRLIKIVPEEQYGVCFPWFLYAQGTPNIADSLVSLVSIASGTVTSAAGAGGGASAGGGGGAGGASGGAG